MSALLVRLPVVCPQCGDWSINEFPVAGLARSLIAADALQLRSTCHEIVWTASPSEREKMRECLTSVFIEGH